MDEILKQLEEALKTMLVATDDTISLPPGHPGSAAFLKIVARPRAMEAIQSLEMYKINLKGGI